MIVDTSAIVAVLAGEPERQELVSKLAAAPIVRMSSGTYLETAIVVDGRRDPVVSRQLDLLLQRLRVEIMPVDRDQVQIARAAYRDFGKGSGHAARLNFGDCFAYSLAAQLNEEILFVGDDFSQTDLRRA